MSLFGSSDSGPVMIPHDPELSELEEEVRDLNLGMDLSYIYDLESWPPKLFDKVVPKLLQFLDKPYGDTTKWTVASLLARKTRAVEAAWSDLVHHFKKPDPPIQAPLASVSPPLFRQALANALVKSYTNDRFQEMAELIRDPRNGKPRYLLVAAFRRRKNDASVRELLLSLMDDPEISPELRTWGLVRPEAP